MEINCFQRFSIELIDFERIKKQNLLYFELVDIR
jgi:hypothetical protein